MEHPTILAIETSCDESASAVVQDRLVLSSVISSQIVTHRVTGGIVPEVASREHLQTLNLVIAEALEQAQIGWAGIDAIAVTCAPGLVGSLLMGAMTAKTLALIHDKPLLAIHHHEGHIFSAFLGDPELEPPFLCLLVSGGDTRLVAVEDYGQYRLLGQTRDDAVGEAYDKVARLLNLGYPGGPPIDKLAQTGNPKAFVLPKGRLDHPYDMSFSGLKTAVLRLVEKHCAQNLPLNTADLVASFQKTVVEVLTDRVLRAMDSLGYSTVVVAGGVSANQGLRSRLTEVTAQRHGRAIFPPMAYCTDNAAMIGCAATLRYKQGYRSDLNVGVFSRLALQSIDELYIRTKNND